MCAFGSNPQQWITIIRVSLRIYVSHLSMYLSPCSCCLAYSCLNVPFALCPIDCAHHPAAPVLPTDVEALGVFPVPWHHDCHISGGLVCFCGDRGELLLHPQHLAHADRRKRRVSFATACQTRRESHSPQTKARLRLPALCK